VSLSSGDEVPHIFTRKSRLRPKEFLISSAKRLLQQNLPESGPMHQQNSNQSITSSASNCIELGTMMPKAFAVLRLITNSNLTDRCTGKSAGFSPLTIRPA
jgi:hypothetical protein